MEFNKKLVAGITAASLILGTPGIAKADNLVNDGDDLTGIQMTLALGTVCAAQTRSDSASHWVTKQGGTNVTNSAFANSATVTFSVTHRSTGLTVGMGDPDHVQLPSDWRSAGNGTKSNAVSSTVSLNTATTGAYTGSVVYQARAPRLDGFTTVTETMTVTANVENCTPPNTAPSVSVTGVTHGASYDKGSVPSATCSVTDAEDGSSSFPATLSAVTGPYASDDIGFQTASCSHTDNEGLAASPASATYSIVDPSAPVISSVLNPTGPDGANGWYKSDVTLTWTVSEQESPNSLSKTGCVDQSITADQDATTYSCSASSAGGPTTGDGVTIKRDGTAPSISGADVTDTTWRNTPLSQSFTATDATSGLADPHDAGFTLTASADSTKVLGLPVPTLVFEDVADSAGNTDTRSLSALIDTVAPIAGFGSTGIQDGGVYFAGHVPTDPAGSCSDALSGIASCEVTGRDTTVGSHTLTATATDEAGNQGIATLTYTVNERTSAGYKSPVRTGTDVVNQVKGGSTVPLKFEVFADDGTSSTELVDTTILKFSVVKYTCDSSDAGSAVDETTTGSTALRYDTAEGQFIQNWKTPTTAGCYKANITVTDGPIVTAQFQVKK